MLVVDNRGDATEAVTAPHLIVTEIRGRSIMVHAGGDNYSDTPAPLGGGGARIACGVIKEILHFIREAQPIECTSCMSMGLGVRFQQCERAA